MKTIIFDLGGVLVDWNPEYVYLNEFDGDRKKMNWFFDNICTSDWNEEQDGGKLIKIATKERIKLFPEHEKLIKMYYGRWEEMLKGEIIESVNILKKLKSKNYKLIALTNWSFETFPVAIRRFDFLKLFDGIVVSGKIKMLKPFKDIYNYTINKHKLSPSECVFIDDRVSNVQGAINCGIKGIHFQSSKQLIRELKKLNIEI
ncbi:MAG: HAD family phosphatase [Flavobacteriaceae bacterium]|nr:HAD family phosphatase [Flavobacteriaceae bacterium]MDC3221124.1 HAD family phosphatase [Flavobacteriaceae bacterium]MDG2485344.1 HAD family phosphatase [Flavobacteriaceae bacterium]